MLELRERNWGSVRRVIGALALILIVAVAASVLAPTIKAFIRRSLKNVVAEVITETVRNSASDMSLAANRQVAEESAAFVRASMGMARPYADKFALFDAALLRVDPKLNGMYCEFGVYTGTTINYVASKVTSLVHGFDSFEGLPENWRAGFETGTFAVKGLPGVRPNVRLYKGWFKDSLPVFKRDHTEPLAFGHLDADLYASTKDVFDALGDRIVAGTVLQFDEFLNYPGWQEGEQKAFIEFCKTRQAEVEYIGYVPSNQQVAVRIKRIGPPRP
jgi:hypothetical protein